MSRTGNAILTVDPETSAHTLSICIEPAVVDHQTPYASDLYTAEMVPLKRLAKIKKCLSLRFAGSPIQDEL